MGLGTEPLFRRSEFACKCGCGLDTVDAELLNVLSGIRANFNTEIIINSGCRCRDHNAFVGGRAKSQHLISRAADIVVTGVLPVIVAEYLDSKYPDCYGIGRYASFTHIDTRSGEKWRNF